VLQVINSSPGDLAPVFGAMLDKAMALCEGSSATLYTIEAEHARTVAVRGASVVPEWMQQQDTFDPPPGSSIDRLRRGERFVHMFDATETEAYRDSPLYREMIDISGCRSSIAVALRKDDTVLGVIAIYRQEVRPFSDKQISLLENFAAQAVIAMENARLLGELRERTRDLQESLEYQTATSDVLKVISRSGAELEPMLRTLVETSLRICDADRGAISLAHPDGLYRPTAPVGFGQEYKDLISDTAFAPEPGSVTGRVASEKQIVHIADVLHDPQFTALEHQRLGDFRTVLGVPLLRDDKVIGVLGVFRVRVEPFTEKQIALFQVFADQAVIAIENARLITETREALEQQTATAEVLQVINSSPGDLAPVFDAMLEKATTLCDAAHGNLWI
jgi:GAF domain-containing protein